MLGDLMTLPAHRSPQTWAGSLVRAPKFRAADEVESAAVKRFLFTAPEVQTHVWRQTCCLAVYFDAAQMLPLHRHGACAA